MKFLGKKRRLSGAFCANTGKARRHNNAAAIGFMRPPFTMHETAAAKSKLIEATHFARTRGGIVAAAATFAKKLLRNLAPVATRQVSLFMPITGLSALPH